MKESGLTPKQRAFVEAYAGNATEAARKAGYKTPGRSGVHLTQNSTIAKAIRDRQSEQLKPLIMNREQRQALWTEFALNPDLTPVERMKASELLGKSEGDFLERRELTGPNGEPLGCGAQILLQIVNPACNKP